MAHKKNGNSNYHLTTEKDANVLATIKFAGKTAETPGSGNQAA